MTCNLKNKCQFLKTRIDWSKVADKMLIAGKLMSLNKMYENWNQFQACIGLCNWAILFSTHWHYLQRKEDVEMDGGGRERERKSSHNQFCLVWFWSYDYIFQQFIDSHLSTHRKYSWLVTAIYYTPSVQILISVC